MSSSGNTHKKDLALQEVRYSLREILEEVQAEKETSSLGQEIVDQAEINKLFNRKKRKRSGESGE